MCFLKSYECRWWHVSLLSSLVILIHFVHLLCLFFPSVTLNPFLGAGQIVISEVIYFEAEAYSIESLNYTRPKATLSWSVLLEMCLYCQYSRDFATPLGKRFNKSILGLKKKPPRFRTLESFQFFFFFSSHLISPCDLHSTNY